MEHEEDFEFLQREETDHFHTAARYVADPGAGLDTRTVVDLEMEGPVG